MRHSVTKTRTFLFMSTLLAIASVDAVAQTHQGSPVAPNGTRAPTSATTELVVDFDDDVWDFQVNSVAEATHLVMRPNSPNMVDETRLYIVTVPTEDATRVINQLRGQPHVHNVEVNRVMRALFVPNDPLYPQQWGMQRVGLANSSDISCGRGVTVAVIDTGVACENHGPYTRLSDLAGTHCVPGWNFVNDTAHANDDQGHGTHVAGTIAQTTNNGLGGSGVAYCSTILPVKVLDSRGSGTLADVADGIRWAADHGAQVINMSIGAGGHSKVMDDAVAYAHNHGVTVVCAAGNESDDVGSPANAPDAIAVSATDDADALAYFSNTGPEIAIAAPGVNILQQTICDHGEDRCEQFASWSGTSMASPHAAAVAALIVSMGVTDPMAVRNAMRLYASEPRVGNHHPHEYGAGIVSAEGATRGLLWHNGMVRAGILGLLSMLLLWVIRSGGGQMTFRGIPAAIQMGVGLFFLPSIFGQMTNLLATPVALWDIALFGTSTHLWLPFCNIGVVGTLVALGFSRPIFRPWIGATSLGVATFYTGELYMNTWRGPLGSTMYVIWAIITIGISLWVARLGMEVTGRERPFQRPIVASDTEGAVTTG